MILDKVYSVWMNLDEEYKKVSGLTKTEFLQRQLMYKNDSYQTEVILSMVKKDFKETSESVEKLQNLTEMIRRAAERLAAGEEPIGSIQNFVLGTEVADIEEPAPFCLDDYQIVGTQINKIRSKDFPIGGVGVSMKNNKASVTHYKPIAGVETINTVGELQNLLECEPGFEFEKKVYQAVYYLLATKKLGIPTVFADINTGLAEGAVFNQVQLSVPLSDGNEIEVDVGIAETAVSGVKTFVLR